MKTKLFKLLRNTFLTTGLTLSVLACVALLAGGSSIFVITVFQHLLANLCVHLGLLCTGFVESRYLLLDSSLDIAVSCVVIVGFGYLFGWFTSTPIWVLIIMVVVVYGAILVLRIVRTRDDLRFINKTLQERTEKELES